jgi:hypothetical protein
MVDEKAKGAFLRNLVIGYWMREKGVARAAKASARRVALLLLIKSTEWHGYNR